MFEFIVFFILVIMKNLVVETGESALQYLKLTPGVMKLKVLITSQGLLAITPVKLGISQKTQGWNKIVRCQ